MKADLETLKDFQLAISRIIELEKKLNDVPEDVLQLETEWNTISGTLEALKTQDQEIEEAIKTFRQELEVAQEKSKKFEEDLNAVTNAKEYSAALKEIDGARKKVSHLQEDLDKKSEESKETKASMETCTSQAKESEKKFKAAKSAFKASLSEYQSELDAKSKIRDEIRTKIPKPLLSQFTRIADRRSGVGLSLVIENICTSCNVLVRANVVDMLRQGNKLLKCESCQRILYYQEPETES